MKFLLIILLLTSCSWTRYKIKKCHHYSRHEIISTINENVMRFDAYFDRSCLYDINMTDGEGDINKLYGFSDCSTIHENSARFGWRHDGNNKIEIFAYLYVNGQRIYWKMGETLANTKDQYEIHADADRYYLRFNDQDTIVSRVERCPMKQRAFPYFGGSMPAPNTMCIYVKEY